MRYLIALFGLALALPHPAVAQAYDWRPVNRQTASMIRAGQYDAVLPLIQAALAECPKAATPLEAGLCTAIFSENLANVQEHSGDLTAAEAGYREALRTRASVLPPNDPLVGQAHLFLALFFERHARREEEITSLQAAEAISRTGGADRRGELAGLLTRHAMALAALGRPGDALPLYQQAYTMASDAEGPTSRDTLVTLGNLFTGQVGAGFPDAAIDAVSAVLASPDVGRIDPTQRGLLAGKLALQTSTAPQSKAALSFAEAALPDLDNGLVTDPDASFTLLRGAARLNAAMGNANRAVELAHRARDLAAATWGPASFAVATALRSEADAEAAHHDVPAAIERLTEAAAMLDNPRFRFTRVEVQVELSRMQSLAGRTADAIAGDMTLLDSAASIEAVPTTKAAMLALLGGELERLQVYDPGAKACGQATDLAANLPMLAKDYVVMALLCSGSASLAQGRATEALDTADRAKTALWANIAAPAEPSRASQIAIADLQARAFRDSGRTAETLAAYRDEQALAHKAGDVGAEGTAWAGVALAQRQMGLNKDADQSSVAGLAALGSDGPPRLRANLLNTRAMASVALGHPADAVPLLESTLALRRSETVTEPFAIASDERELAAALSTLGRNAEAGRHMDLAIDGFRALGPSQRPYLVAALDRRVTIATAAGDPQRAESALRELLPLQDPASDDATSARIVLADLLDNQARRQEAATLRAEALSIATTKHGENSAPVMRVRLAVVASLRATGRLAEAETAARQCMTLAKALPEMLLPCLMAQAETALSAGSYRDAAEVSARAVVEAETHWTQNANDLRQALLLQARAEAAIGDVETVIRLYDRIHVLTPGQGGNRGWTDFGEGRLLMQTGETSIGLPMLQLSLDQANRLHDTGLAVAATGILAEHLVDTGRGRQAIAMWVAVLPMLSEDAPIHRVTVLEGLGNAVASMGQAKDAARFFGEAVSLSRTEMGAGSFSYASLVMTWAEALMRSGEPAPAENAMRLLAGDTSPEVQRLRTIGLMRLASMADDPVANTMLARSTFEQARAAFGPDSVGAAYARLDLIEALIDTNKHVDAADMEDALRIIQAQDPSWHAAYRAARLRALLASRTGRPQEATTWYMQAELLATAHEGPGSLAAAIQHSNRASIRLQDGHPDEADALFRQALEMAAPDGDRQNTVWARIAGAASAAAERVGDIARSMQLRNDSDRMLPPVKARLTMRWL